MINGRVFMDSFSGDAASLPPRSRTPDHVLTVLRTSPRVSTWDMGEEPWLRYCIDILKRDGKITEDSSEPYPWHRFNVCAQQRSQP